MSPLLTLLRQPDYLHVLLNPLPVYGLAMGVLALATGLLLRSRAAVVCALVVVLVSAGSAWPVYILGQSTYENVNADVDAIGASWLQEHQARAEKSIWTFYVVTVLAACALALPVKWPRYSFPLAATTLVCAIGVLCIGAWIAYAGGKVRHREFRFEPPPKQMP